MTLNWYLDTDGESHRLHSAMGWTGAVVGDIPLPADNIITLGTIDATALILAVDEVTRALQALPGSNEAGAEVLHLVTADRDGTEYLIVCGKTEHAATSRALPWTPQRAQPQFHAAAIIEDLEAMQGAAGTVEVSLGADSDWDATFVLTGSSELRRVPLGRHHLGTPPFRLAGGEPFVTCTLERDQLAEIAARVPADQDLTIALVPGRVMVRSDDGLLGTIQTETTGTPLQSTFPAGRLAAGLHALPGFIRRPRLSFIDDAEHPALRLDDPDALSRFSLLSSGWRYR